MTHLPYILISPIVLSVAGGRGEGKEKMTITYSYNNRQWQKYVHVTYSSLPLLRLSSSYLYLTSCNAILKIELFMAIVRQSIEIEIKCCLPVVADVVVVDVVASKRVVVAAFATAFDMCADRFSDFLARLGLRPFNRNCDLKYLYLDRFGIDRMSPNVFNPLAFRPQVSFGRFVAYFVCASQRFLSQIRLVFWPWPICIWPCQRTKQTCSSVCQSPIGLTEVFTENL